MHELKAKLAWLRSSLSLSNALLYVLSRCLRTVHPKLRLEKYYLVAQPVSLTEPPPSRLRPDIIVTRLDDEDSPLIGSFPQAPEVIAQRLRDDCLCLIATSGDSYCGYLWLRFGSFYEVEDRCLITPVPETTTAWDFDVYVEPRFRLTPTFARLWREANRCLHERGVAWSLSRISAFNTASSGGPSTARRGKSGRARLHGCGSASGDVRHRAPLRPSGGELEELPAHPRSRSADGLSGIEA